MLCDVWYSLKSTCVPLQVITITYHYRDLLVCCTRPSPNSTCLTPRCSFSLQAPVFLLFLDCVFQLTNQFLSSFEFSETYLMCLYDTVLSGLHCTFLFNSAREYFDTRRPYGSEQGAQGENYHDILLQAWGRWMETLPHDVCERCYNPLNFLFASQVKKEVSDGINTTPIDQGRISTNLETVGSEFVFGGSLGLYTKTMAYQAISTDKSVNVDKRKSLPRMNSLVVNSALSDTVTVLSPQTFQCKLKFWSGFFFRYVPASNEPFKEVLRVEDVKSQLVREARQYKDSLREHELRNWSHRHTLSFDEVPRILSEMSDSHARHRSDSDTTSKPSMSELGPMVRVESSPPQQRRESPIKPPRPGKSPIMKSKVQVKSGKMVQGSQFSMDDSILLTHMTQIENGNQGKTSSLTRQSRKHTDSREETRISWVTESEEVDAL